MIDGSGVSWSVWDKPIHLIFFLLFFFFKKKNALWTLRNFCVCLLVDACRQQVIRGQVSCTCPFFEKKCMNYLSSFACHIVKEKKYAHYKKREKNGLKSARTLWKVLCVVKCFFCFWEKLSVQNYVSCTLDMDLHVNEKVEMRARVVHGWKSLRERGGGWWEPRVRGDFPNCPVDCPWARSSFGQA